MKTYPSYKDSGVEWIGEIPSGWGVRKLNHICSKVRNGYVGPTRGIMKDSGVKYIQGIHIKNGDVKFTPDGEYYVTEEWSQQHSGSILHEGDVLVVQTGTIGNIGYVQTELENSNCHALIIVRIYEDVGIGRFLLYYFLSNYVQSYLQTIKTGEILYHINTKKLRPLDTLVPEPQEQLQIVSYLDKQTKKIDDLIDKTEKKIELLKEKRTALINHCVTKGLNHDVEMKDSGVEWIGEIPENWKYSRLGFGITTLVPMRDKPKDLKGNIPWIRIEDYDGKYISKSKSNQGVSLETIAAMNLKLYPVGTVLCTCSCSLGTTMIATRSLVSNQTFIGLVPDEKHFESEFLYYLLQVFKNELDRESSGSIQQYLSRDHFKSLKVLKPTIPEQKRIVSYLDEQNQRIDSTIEVETKRIELLKEYRQSLISNVVTGKIDVRDEVAI